MTGHPVEISAVGMSFFCFREDFANFGNVIFTIEIGPRSYRCLDELTVGILGVGEMGRDAAKKFKVFGCRTLGLVRTAPKDR